MILEEKKTIRKEIKSILENYKNNFAKDSKTISDMILSSSEYKNADTVLTYMALPDEVNLNISNFDSSKNIFIPKVNLEKSTMDFYKYSNNLEKGAYDILEPSSSDFFDLSAAEKYGNILILVPGRAFTMEGARLGRGKGYYDKFFEKLFSHFEKGSKKVILAGVCFKPQILPYIPTDKFDIKMDKIITTK